MSATPGGSGGKLESLSKDDVIKFAKRQTLLLGKAKGKIDELTKKLESAESKSNEGEADGRLQELEVENNRIKEELVDAKEKLAQTRERYAEVEEERLAAVTGYQSLQTTLEQIQGTHSETCQRLEETIQQLTNHNAGLEEENECLKMQKSSTLESVKALQVEHQKLSEEKSLLEQQHKETSDELTEANRLKEKLMVNFKALKQKYLELKNDKGSVSPSPSQSAGETESLRAQVDSLTQLLEESKASLSQSSSANDTLQEELTNVKAELGYKTAEYDALKLQCDSGKTEYNSLQVEYDSVQTEYDASKLKYDSMKADYDLVKTQYDSVNEDCRLLKIEMAKLEDQLELGAAGEKEALDEHQSEISCWQQKVEEMKKGYEQTILIDKALIAELQSKVKDMEESHSQSMSRVEELVLGLGRESADTTTKYEEQISVYELKITQLEEQVEKLSSNPQSSQASEIMQTVDVTISDSNQVVNSTASSPGPSMDAKPEGHGSSEAIEIDNQSDGEVQVEAPTQSDIQVTESNCSDRTDDRVQELEKCVADRDAKIKQQENKISELVNYCAKLKAKCKLMLETNDQLVANVQQMERKIQNDARGARNIQLHFQEAENNVNEHIAHFHTQRDEMIAQVNEYAASIERLRAQMMPYRESEQESVQIIYKGLCSLAEFCGDIDSTPGGSLVEMTKLLVNTSQRLKGFYNLRLHQIESLTKTEGNLKRITLNWRSRFEEGATLNRTLVRKLDLYEKKIVELGGSPNISEEVETVDTIDHWKLTEEPMDSAELENHAEKFKEEELDRLYKEQDKHDKEVRQLQKDLSEKNSLLIMLKADQAELAKSKAEEAGSSAVPLVSASVQTEQSESVDEELQTQKEIIQSLRLELANQADSGTGEAMSSLRDRIEEAENQLESKDVEIEHLTARIGRFKSQLSEQADQLEDLNIQLSKNRIQEKFQLCVGDSHTAETQAALASALLSLKCCNEDKEALHVEVERLQQEINSTHGKRVPQGDEQLVSEAESGDLLAELEQMKVRNDKLDEETRMFKSQLFELLKSTQSVFSEMREGKEDLSQQDSGEQVSENTAEDSASSENQPQQAYSEILCSLKTLFESQAHRISLLKNELCQMRSQLDSERVENSKIVQENDNLQQRLSAQKEDMESSLSKLNASNEDTLKVEVGKQEAQIVTLQEEIKSVNDALAESKIQSEQAMEKSTLLSKQFEELQLQNNNLLQFEAKCSELEITISNLECERSQLEQLVSEKTQESVNFSDLLKEAEQNIVELKADAEEKETLLAEKSEELTSLSQESSELAKRPEQLSSVITDLRTEVDKLTEELNRKDGDMTTLENEKAALHQTVASSAEDNDILRKNVEVLTSEIKTLKEEKLDLEETIQSSAADHDEKVRSHESRISSLLAEAEGMTKHIEELQRETGKLPQLIEDNKELTRQIGSKQEEVESLSKRVLELQRDLDAARKDVMESSMSSHNSEDVAADDTTKLKEVEERANKFKLLALKAKRELMESKSQVDKLKTELQATSKNKVEDMQRLANNYQHLQQDFDRLQDDLDAEKGQVSSLQEQLEAERSVVAQLKVKINSLVEEKDNITQTNHQLQSKVKNYESQMSEWKTKILALESDLDSKHGEATELNKNISRLMEQIQVNNGSSKTMEDRLRAKISELEVKVHEARDELEQANRTASKSSVMHLEIADFERTVSNLQSEVKEKEESVSNLQQELEHQKNKCASVEKELASADQQRISTEGRCEKLQQIINKTRSELDEARQQESQSKTTDLAMRGELELLRQQHEELKVEMAKISSARIAAEDKLKMSQESQSRLVRSMENKQRALQSDLESSREELTVLQQDYDSYKVRVHSVLKQQQTRASVEAALENERVEKTHLQEMLSQVKVKLQETVEKLQTSLSENSLLQDEVDKLSLKCNKLSLEMANKETVWRQRLDQLMAENSAIASEHSSTISQMNERSEAVANAFKEQLKSTQSEHELQVSMLTNKIERLEDDKASLFGEVQMLRKQTTNGRHDQVVETPVKQSITPLLASTPDLRLNVRESGEGMEHPIPLNIPPSPATQFQVTPNTIVGLETLLTSADDDSHSVVSLNTQASEGVDDPKLKSKLKLSEKQAEHLRELLNESEATCSRYNEQVKILKQEIRRLESNQQRENSISNMEYLKNIVYKFLSLESGDEKSRLLPVLNTMLKFSDEEMAELRVIALSGSESETSAQGQGTWSGYLHRWTGFSS